MAQLKKPTSIRLSADAVKLRVLLAKKLGITPSAVVELALRRLAEAEGVDVGAVRSPSLAEAKRRMAAKTAAASAQV